MYKINKCDTMFPFTLICGRITVAITIKRKFHLHFIFSLNVNIISCQALTHTYIHTPIRSVLRAKLLVTLNFKKYLNNHKNMDEYIKRKTNHMYCK